MAVVLTKAQILGASDLKTRRVTVPEWGGDVFVRMMTGEERDQFETKALSKEGITVAFVVAMLACDGDGNRMFEEADITALQGKAAAPLLRVYRAGMSHNRLSAKDVEDAEKNSAAGQSGTSASA